MSGDPVVFVPADVEVEDRLAGPVTFPMAGWLALAAIGAALAVLRWPAPLPVSAGGALLAVGLLAALFRPDGRSLLTWLRLLYGYGRRRKVAAVAEPADEPVDVSVAAGADEDSLVRRPHPARHVSRAALVVAVVALLGASLGVGGRLLFGRAPASGPAAPAPFAPVAPVAPVVPSPWPAPWGPAPDPLGPGPDPLGLAPGRFGPGGGCAC